MQVVIWLLQAVVVVAAVVAVRVECCLVKLLLAVMLFTQQP
jgi:hypothetical protein